MSFNYLYRMHGVQADHGQVGFNDVLLIAFAWCFGKRDLGMDRGTE